MACSASIGMVGACTILLTGCDGILGLSDLHEVDCVDACPGSLDAAIDARADSTVDDAAIDTAPPDDLDSGGPTDLDADASTPPPDSGPHISDASSDADGSARDGSADSTVPPPDAMPDAMTDAMPDALTDAGADGDAPADSAPPLDGGDGSTCPGTAGASGVRVGAYCVDSTETTNSQYATFLTAKGADTTGQPTKCSSNTTYTPGGTWPVLSADLGRPVVGVDWCDALAYCTWAGKRLCGAISGGSAAPADYQTAGANQWYAACSAQGTRTFPYGTTFVSGRCNDGNADAGRSLSVGSLTGCVGGSPGIFDMSGNVWEWEDSCEADTSGTDVCYARGGSYVVPSSPTTGPLYSCSDRTSNATRASSFANVGFRCCAP